jgi:hypothetical protein
MEKPIKLKMLTIEKDMELELIFDDESLQTLDDLDITVNYFGDFLKLNIKKKAD